MKFINLLFVILAAIAVCSVHAQTGTPALTQPALKSNFPATPSVFERQEIRAQLLPLRYTTIAAEIGAKKQSLRDATNIDSGSITNLSDVKSLWDTDILGETPYR